MFPKIAHLFRSSSETSSARRNESPAHPTPDSERARPSLDRTRALIAEQALPARLEREAAASLRALQHKGRITLALAQALNWQLQDQVTFNEEGLTDEPPFS